MIDLDEPDISLRNCVLAGVETSGDRLRLHCEDVVEDRKECLVGAYIDLCNVTNILCNGHEVATFEMKMPDCEILEFEKRDEGVVVMLLVWTDFARHESSTDVYEFTVGTFKVNIEDD